VIEVHVDERPEPLAARLAQVLAEPTDDPFAPEWFVVPSERMRRWLHLELARHLGASPGRHDGVLANVRSAFPGSLRSAVLAAGAEDEVDPWEVERLTWALLEVADLHPEEAGARVLRPPAAGGSRYGRARRVADLFDRYHLQRPDMIFAWRNDRPVDGLGKQISEHHRWQPDLWRLVREHLGQPSPPERLPHLLSRVSRGELTLDLPPRLVVFGLTVLQGGPGFLDVVQSVGAGGEHDVHVHLLEPSVSLGARLATGIGDPEVTPLRADDDTVELVQHPLLASWGRLSRETAVLTGRSSLPVVRPTHAGAPSRAEVPAGDALDSTDGPVQGDLFATPPPVPPPAVASGLAEAGTAPTTVLGRLQHDLRADRAPVADLVPAPDDRSVQLHECFGPTRQVEALRDAVLHLLADPELALSEDDIVVGCPSLDLFTPLIEAVLGPSAKAEGTSTPPVVAVAADPRRAPALRYGIAQRSVRSSNPTVAALLAVLQVVSGRFEAPAVLDLLSMAPMRQGARMSEDDLAQVGEWVEEANVRWGLDAVHRARHGLDHGFTANTWRQALDRLLLGVAVADDDPVLGIGDVSPLGAEGDAALLAGRLAAVLWQLERLSHAAAQERPLGEWVAWLRDLITSLFRVGRDDTWQLERLHEVLAELEDTAAVAGSPSATVLQLADVRRMLADRLDQDHDRPVHFRGGITFCELSILRWVPARVVCLLGMDESALTVGGSDGDDLVAASARFGDADRRGDSREALLETVLAAEERLLIFRDGRDLHTNQEVPTPIPVAELHDVVAACVHPDAWDHHRRRLVVRHPRQAYDHRAFEAGEVDGEGPWSFDPGALAAAEARAHQVGQPPLVAVPLVAQPADTIELDALRRFLKQPVKTFFDRRLEVRFPAHDDPVSARLPVDLVALSQWKVADRLLRTLLEGGTEDEWLRIERQRGTLPPGAIGEQKVRDLVLQVGLIAGAAEARGLARGLPQPLPVDVTLADGTRVVGSVDRRLGSPTPGPAFVTFSSWKPVHRLQAWLDLMALTATEASTPWRSLAVSRNSGWKADKHADAETDVKAYVVCDLEPKGEAEAAEALEVVVDCYRRALVEPVPLFPALSYEVFDQGAPRSNTWNSGPSSPVPGDGDDEAAGLAFPFGVDELLALPARPDDPAGTAEGRVARYAERLWSTVFASALDRDGVEEPA
jgi:exodeoxyribonuclease V gamma subunit